MFHVVVTWTVAEDVVIYGRQRCLQMPCHIRIVSMIRNNHV